MSAVGGGDIPRPTSPHADVILGTLWPLQSESSWHAFAAAIDAESARLFSEDVVQQDILRLVASDQAGAFITAAIRVVQSSIGALEDRYGAYAAASRVAEGVSSRVWAVKLRMAESVDAAETAITAAKNELEPQIDAALSMLDGVRAAALTGELEGRITAAITKAQSEVVAEAASGAAEISALDAKVSGSQSGTAPNAAGAQPMSWGNLPAAPALPLPADTSGVQPAGYETFKEGTDGLSDRMPESRPAEDPTLSQAAQDSNRFPHEVTPREAANRDVAIEKSATPGGMPKSPTSSAPSMGGASSAASNPASVLGSMTQPMSSASSSASPTSASTGSAPSSGVPGSATPAPQAGNGAGISGAGRAVPGASLGTGIAESSARMATGAVSATANAVGTAGNVGAQVAHGAAAAAPPQVAGPPAGPNVAPPAAAPMPMIPPSMAPPAVAGGLSPAAPAGPANAGPAIPGSSQPGPVAAANLAAAAGGPGVHPTPVMMPMSQVRTIGLDGATGDVLIGQAADAARSIVETMIAQTRRAGYGSSQGFVWAVTVIAERTGGVTAWLATSEGPSYIPPGVRVPDDVRLAVTDEVVGRQLWDAAAAAGGADPLEVLARHAELRDTAAPGLRVLAFAASVPMSRVMDWAAVVGARPVSVDPRTIDPAPAHGDEGQHRCAVAMPWEWQQASAFSEQQRRQVAVRHMLMAANAGHLTAPGCERVMDAFERGAPITDSDWADVHQAFAVACVNYEMARSSVTTGGGATPLEWAFRTARAAEVVWCLRDFGSAEGCADLLYASRLAGAPLSPASAVA